MMPTFMSYFKKFIRWTTLQIGIWNGRVTQVLNKIMEKDLKTKYSTNIAITYKI